ncbi:MAG: hypothetical protein RMK18_07225 [Armatimonadota bacterium]|nr:hypothetical protein [Armatimonadota bacterium]MCX7777927.1 hypothetical protein [Armatimonadota bacterium]MDW8025640.1 hypothetical protein [Armatimonadota bacterium]
MNVSKISSAVKDGAQKLFSDYGLKPVAQFEGMSTIKGCGEERPL